MKGCYSLPMTAYIIPPTTSELLEQILQEIKDIKGVLTKEHIEQKIGLDLNTEQIDDLVKQVQAALLKNARRNPPTGITLNPFDLSSPLSFPSAYDDEDDDE